MVDLSDFISQYFSFEWDKHQEFNHYLQKFYNNPHTRITHIISQEYQIKARVGHYWLNSDNTIELAEYSGDRNIIRETLAVCEWPLTFIPDCNFMYYGCYLTVCAYLLKKDPKRLMLFHGPDDNRMYTFKYRPQIAQFILGQRLKSLKAISAKEENELTLNLI